MRGLNSFFEGLVSGFNGHFFVARSNYSFAWSAGEFPVHSLLLGLAEWFRP